MRDIGPGHRAEERARVFDRFYRAPAGAADVPGSGLGLAIVKRIADAARCAEIARCGTGGRGLAVVVAVARRSTVPALRDGARSAAAPLSLA